VTTITDCSVMAGLVPAIHALTAGVLPASMDARHKAGHDRRKIWTRGYARSFASSSLVGILLLSAGTSHALAGDDLAEFAFRPHPGAQLPLAAEFVDEQGREVRLGQFFSGKPVILVLDYLRCQTLCGVTLEKLVAALDTLPLDAGRDFEVTVISIDPGDKPADIAAAKLKYLAGYNRAKASKGWHFLTGEAVRTVADAVGFPYHYDPALDQYIHPAGFVVAAPGGRISHYMLGVSALPSDLRAALGDAAQRRAVGLVQRLLLLCHGKDPNFGPNSLMIEAAFMVANLTAMAGGAIAFFMIWRRRHG
jgi:protein SCO1